MVAVNVQLVIDSIVGSFNKATEFLITLENGHAKMLAIGGHMGDILGDEGHLNYQVNLARPLEGNRAIGLLVLLGNSSLSKRIILKRQIHLAVDRLYACQSIYLLEELILIGLG